MSESQRYTDDQKHVDPIYGLKEDLATAQALRVEDAAGALLVSADITGGTIDEVTCCCIECADNRGYLNDCDIMKMDNTDRVLADSLWTNGYGYYDPSIGCKLPMELRSFTCRSYVCKHSKKGSTWAER